MTTRSIDDLARTLGRQLAVPGGSAQVAGAIAEYAREATDWRDHARFEAGAYTRHLLARTPRFELILICWDRGLASDLHDHSGQSCWMTLLDGSIEEDRFRCDGAGGVTRVGTLTLNRAEPAFIDDGLGLHVIRSCGDAPSASLHLYALPVESCGIYCRETGAVLEERELGYDSIREGCGPFEPRSAPRRSDA